MCPCIAGSGSTTAPPRDQMPEPEYGHDVGAGKPRSPLHSELKTFVAPSRKRTLTTWPLYGGASPLYPDVVAYTYPFATLSAAAAFSVCGIRVMRTGKPGAR